MGKFHQKDKNYEKAIYFFHQAALQDSHEAFYELGRHHQHGWGCPKSDQEARELYTKASDLDEAREALSKLN